MIAAIYVRVSTLDQAENGYSLAAQKKALIVWAKSHGYEHVIFYSDEGISGKDIIHRPAMQQLLSDARDKKFNCVVVWSLSRLTRSVSDLYYTWELLQKKGIDLYSYTESFDTSTSIGRAMMGLLGVFAQMEREITAERVRAAMEERASQGKRTCGIVLGYDSHGKDGLKINNSEAKVVNMIFDTYLQVGNLSEVARRCDRLGYHGKYGRVFKPEHIKVILSRPIYKGYYSYNGKQYKGNFRPIISDERWNTVQKMLKENGKGRKVVKST